uniref:Uncharacterized protein n=1 Tax=Globisporangium ultimum (strain ATCC 200006 / CBS 805.95 / DAOM BR144) TaxID=431595 RepID=K3X335_GLOUD
MVLYGMTKNLPKGQAIGATIAGVLTLSYATFAFFRYTGPDLGGNVPGSPKTMSPEWEAASVEYARVQKANPIRHFKQ